MKKLDLRELTKRFMNKEMLRAPSVKDNAQTALIGLAILVSGLFSGRTRSEASVRSRRRLRKSNMYPRIS